MENLMLPIKFTDNALKELKRLMNENPSQYIDKYLRIGVKGGGCSGMTYLLGFENIEEDDDIYSYDNIPIVMKRTHSIYLLGMEVHFEGGLSSRGFTFQNPNASSTCGCGSSFAV